MENLSEEEEEEEEGDSVSEDTNSNSMSNKVCIQRVYSIYIDKNETLKPNNYAPFWNIFFRFERTKNDQNYATS